MKRKGFEKGYQMHSNQLGGAMSNRGFGIGKDWVPPGIELLEAEKEKEKEEDRWKVKHSQPSRKERRERERKGYNVSPRRNRPWRAGA